MKLQRALVTVAALAFLGLGISFLFWPVEMAGYVDIQLPTSMAKTDLRATYGGFEWGFGLFLLYCALKKEHLLTGLLAASVCIGGFGISRVFGILADGQPTSMMVAFVAIELTSSAVMGGLYMQAKGSKKRK